MSDDDSDTPKITVDISEKDEEEEENVDITDDDDSDYVPGEDDEIIDQETYEEFLLSLFPSKFLKNKIDNQKTSEKKQKSKAFSKLKKNRNKKKLNSNKKSSNSKSNNKNSNKSKTTQSQASKKNKLKKKKIKKKERKKEVDSLDADFDDEEESDEDDIMGNHSGKFNIIYTFGNEKEEDDADCETDYESSDSDINTEEEEEYNEIIQKNAHEATDEEWEKVLIMEEKKIKKKEKEHKNMLKTLKEGDRVKVKEKHWSKKYIGTIKKIVIKKTKKTSKRLFTIELDNDRYKLLKNVPGDIILEKIKNKTTEKKMDNALKELIILKNKNEEEFNKQFAKYQEKYDAELKEIEEEKEKKLKVKNVTRFKKLLKEKDKTNDVSYFRNMKIAEQRNILKNLVEINSINNVDKPYKIRLLESPIKAEIKSIALKKVNLLTMMDPYSGDYYKNKLWVDTFMTIPFGVHSKLPININDGLDKCQEFMKSAKERLDNVVYGLNDAKMQIMQMVGSWISNPQAIGTAIAIHGPMGTGKTTLVKEGISKILNRPFAFIPLGGATDSSYLEGHSYTYEGSLWGKIVDVLIHSKSMNPVFYFDELDKVSNTPKGEEIIGILTHLTDTTQNSQFHDKYFSNLDFDLSKALFIFSYNEESKVNSILKDRMYRIKTAGYTKEDKLTISKKYLIPKIEKNLNFKEGDVIFEDNIIEYIITNYTMDEKGVRNLKRCYEIIFTKLNLYRLMEKDTTLFQENEYIEVEFPFTITTQHLSKLIKEKDKSNIPFGMYI
tara:strand:+ start:10237 stop:12567 length:2331 start_codon:yes stop_codon:yes gene_type:complete